jgi:glycosyltransferase involved in cell wall biosynthesis
MMTLTPVPASTLDAAAPPGDAARLTVCQVLHTLNVGGAEMLAARLARRLKRECRFLFACLDERGTLGEALAGEGFPVHVLERRSGLDWRCAWRLGRLLRRERVDVIHAHQYTPFFYAVLARQLYRRAPIMFTEHGRHFPDYPRRKRMLFNRLMLRKRDRVVGVGKAVADALIANEGMPAPRVEVVYNGIDTDAFAAACADCAGLRRELDLREADFVIIQVARLDYLKDHAAAVRTMHRLASSTPRARLLLVGEGPERGKIEALVRELGLEGHVRFLGLRQDVARLLPAADVFLLTSISEGIPLTVIEAMAAGLPVVSTRVGGLAEVVEEGATGLLAPAGDDAALAAHLHRLVEDAELRRRLGQGGQIRAGALFSERQMHARYRDLYRQMASIGSA